MAVTTPSFAIVRPRAIVKRTGEAGLLEDIIAEIADEFGSGFIRLTGGPGSGKSTALAHLAAVFSYDDKFVFLDEPTTAELEACSSDSVTVATTPAGDGRNMELVLQPWGTDELIEYLLAEHHDACGAVVERLAKASKFRWSPQLGAIVLTRLASDPSLVDPIDALLRHIEDQLPKAKQRLVASEYSFAMLCGKGSQIESFMSRYKLRDLPAASLKLLRHDLVQLPLAVRHLLGGISKGEFSDLKQELPWSLLKAVGEQCAGRPEIISRLAKSLDARRHVSAQPMAATILFAADSFWRPYPRQTPWRLTRGMFRYAEWSKLELSKAALDHCDFSGANFCSTHLNGATLIHAIFDDADLSGATLFVVASDARFQRAKLAGANLTSAKLCRSDFQEADLTKAMLNSADLTGANLAETNLQEADLTNARLVDSILEEADLSGATLNRADLSRVDLRQTVLDGVSFENAVLKESQLEDVCILGAVFTNANLSNAYLTGSRLVAADLRGADLSGAKLGEIDWEGADLRGANLKGATFHMGSSRSGLVGSPYACEGSKTGFYTDDFEDLNFKRPEEIRKANLCGADLRGVIAAKVDFYLVDLRRAKFDPPLFEQARDSGAILRDPCG